MQGLMVPEAFATCILAHIVYIIYYSNKLRIELPIMKLFKRYTIYITSILFSFFIIGYDVAIGNSQNAIVHSYCTPLNTIYTTTDTFVALNKLRSLPPFLCTCMSTRKPALLKFLLQRNCSTNCLLRLASSWELSLVLAFFLAFGYRFPSTCSSCNSC